MKEFLMELVKLVYDVGMHAGEDTECYLGRGCCVVGIEANPTLVEQLRDKFKGRDEQRPIASRGKPIAKAACKMQFAIFKGNVDIWSSGITPIIEQNAAIAAVDPELEEVDAVPFADVIREYGVPYYMKVGIDG